MSDDSSDDGGVFVDAVDGSDLAESDNESNCSRSTASSVSLLISSTLELVEKSLNDLSSPQPNLETNPKFQPSLSTNSSVASALSDGDSTSSTGNHNVTIEVGGEIISVTPQLAQQLLADDGKLVETMKQKLRASTLSTDSNNTNNNTNTNTNTNTNNSKSQQGRTQRLESVSSLSSHSSCVNVDHDDATTAIQSALQGSERGKLQEAMTIKNLDTGESFDLKDYEVVSQQPAKPKSLSKDSRRGSLANLFRRSSLRTSQLLPASSVPVSGAFRVTVHHKQQQELTEVALRQNMQAHTGAVWAMAFSTCGRFLATAGQDKTVNVWQLKTDEVCTIVRDPFRVYTGHTADVLQLAWSKSKFLLSASMDKTVRLWHTTKSECLSVFQHIDFVTSIAFHPTDDKFFLSGCLDEKLRIWHIPEHACVKIVDVGSVVTSGAFSPDGLLCLAGTIDGRIHIYHAQSLALVGDLDVKSSRGKNQGKRVTSITFANDGQMMLVSSNDCRLRLYRLRSNYSFSLVCKYKGHKNKLSQIAASFSPEGQYIISGSEDHHIYLWNREPQGSSGPMHKTTTSDSYESLAVSDFATTVTLFAPATILPEPLEQDSPVPTPRNTPQQPQSECLTNQVLFVADSKGTVRVLQNKGLPRPVK